MQLKKNKHTPFWWGFKGHNNSSVRVETREVNFQTNQVLRRDGNVEGGDIIHRFTVLTKENGDLRREHAVLFANCWSIARVGGWVTLWVVDKGVMKGDRNPPPFPTLLEAKPLEQQHFFSHPLGCYHVVTYYIQVFSGSMWVFPKMVVPPKHPKMVIFRRKTTSFWVPPFLETPMYTFEI